MEEPHKTHKEPAWGWIGALGLVRPKAFRGPNAAKHATRCRADLKNHSSSVAPAGPYAP